MTSAQFIITWAGYISKQRETEKFEWERARAMAIAIGGCPEGKSVQDAWPFPWDEKHAINVDQISEEERHDRVNDIMRGG